jgi:NAD(P)-dependent dehydrogenase (short-subunit alcohol dehydrogenase family)
VVLADVVTATAITVAQQLPEAGAYASDVRDENSVAALIDHALNQYGRLDIAVANAGIATVSPLMEISLEMGRSMMSINLDGIFLTVKYAARAMVTSQTPGSIITMGSVTALCGTPPVAHYAAGRQVCTT